MIFKQWEDVLAGRKTQTRRIVKPGEACRDGMSVAKTWSNVVLGTTGHRAWEPYYLKWQVGRTYAVQPGRGKKAVGRIRITEIRRERLQEISLEDVLAEGVGIRINGELYPITVRDVAHEEFARLWGSIHTKPGTRWQDDPETWALTFELAQRA